MIIFHFLYVLSATNMKPSIIFVLEHGTSYEISFANLVCLVSDRAL